MKCSRCGDRGADRTELRFRNGSRVILYLCRTCAETERSDDAVAELVLAEDA